MRDQIDEATTSTKFFIYFDGSNNVYNYMQGDVLTISVKFTLDIVECQKHCKYSTFWLNLCKVETCQAAAKSKWYYHLAVNLIWHVYSS